MARAKSVPKKRRAFTTASVGLLRSGSYRRVRYPSGNVYQKSTLSMGRGLRSIARLGRRGRDVFTGRSRRPITAPPDVVQHMLRPYAYPMTRPQQGVSVLSIRPRRIMNAQGLVANRPVRTFEFRRPYVDARAAMQRSLHQLTRTGQMIVRAKRKYGSK